jgi:hypothetical protein
MDAKKPVMPHLKVFSSTQVSSLSQNSHINPQRVPNRVTR